MKREKDSEVLIWTPENNSSSKQWRMVDLFINHCRALGKNNINRIEELGVETDTYHIRRSDR